MAIEIKIKFNDLTEYDVFQYADSNYVLNQACLNSEFKHVRNSLSMRIALTPTIHNKFLNNKKDIDFSFKDGSTFIFTGVISPSISSSLSNDFINYLDLDVVDYSDLLDVSLTSPITMTNAKLYDSTAPTLSVVHKLLTLITSKTITVESGTADFTIPYLAFKTGDKVSDILEEIMFNFGYQYYFDEEGILKIIKWNTDTTTTTSEIGDDGASVIDQSFNIIQKASNTTNSTADSVTSYYTPVVVNSGVSLGTSVYLANRTAYFTDNAYYNNHKYVDDESFPRTNKVFNLSYSGLPDDEVLDINLTGANVEFWPSFDLAENPGFGIDTGIYLNKSTNTCSVNVSGLGSAMTVYRDTEASGKIGKLPSLSKTVHFDFTSLVKRSFATWELQIKKTDATSTSEHPIILRTITPYGDVVVKRPKVDIENLGTNKNIVKLENKYLYTKEFAQAFVDMYKKNILESSISYQFKSYNKYELGENIQVTFSSKSFSTTAKVLKRNYSYRDKIYTYEMKGLTGIETPVVEPDGINYPLPVVIDGIDPVSGTLTGIIDGTSLPPDYEPVETGLYFTKERFGYYDCDTETWGVSINKDGTAQLEGVISSGGLQSTNFETGSAGFRITDTGNAEFNDVTIRGDLIKMTGVPIDNDDVINVSYAETELAKLGTFTGFQLTNNATDWNNDLDIGVGETPNDINTRLIKLTTPLVKRLDANFVAGTNQGGLDTGTKANGWYSVWVIMSTDASLVDCIFSTSSTSPTMPTGYTLKKRIGWILVSAGGIAPFFQTGRWFAWKYPATIRNYAVDATITRQLQTVTAPPNTLARLEVHTGGGIGDGWIRQTNIYDMETYAYYSNLRFEPTTNAKFTLDVLTDSSSQVARRHSNTTSWLGITTPGFTDDLSSCDSGNVSTKVSTSTPSGAIQGLSLVNNPTTPNTHIDISAGIVLDSTYTTSIALTSGLTKRLDASWAVGSGSGGLDTGAKANSTWYAVYVIKRIDTGVVDVLFSLSATSPTMPTDYTLQRIIGWIYSDSSGNILGFTQYGRYFEYKVVQPVTGVTLASSARQVLTAIAPPDSTVKGSIQLDATTSTYGMVWIKSTMYSDVAVTSSNAVANSGVSGLDYPQFSIFEVPLNNSKQFAYRQNTTLTGVTINIHGFSFDAGGSGGSGGSGYDNNTSVTPTANRATTLDSNKNLPIQGVTYTTGTISSFTGTKNIDWNLGEIFTAQITGNVTLTFSNPRVTNIRLIVFHNSTQYTVTFPTCYSIGTTSTSAKVYTLPTTGIKRTMFDIFYDGSNYYVSEGKFYA